MLVKTKTLDGREAWRANFEDIKMISLWVKSFLHAAYGPDLGEQRYRAFRLKDALELWCSQPQSES